MEHDQRAVAQADDFLRFAGQDADGHAVFRQTQDDVVNLFLRAHVYALRGVIKDQYARPGAEPLGEHDLLLVAAGEAGDQVVR